MRGTKARRVQVRTSAPGGLAPKKHPNLQPISIEMIPQDNEFDMTRFDNMRHVEEFPHNASDICCSNNMVSALFDINIGDLKKFGNIPDEQLRRQLSEPFLVGDVWWMLGIEKKLHSQADMDRSNDDSDDDDIGNKKKTNNENDDSDDDEPTIDIDIHLFCLSIKCDFDRDHSHPIMMPIRRGENVFCTESGLTFGNPAHSVQLPGSINFFLTSGKSKGARTITLGRGNGLIMDGKQHYPLRATVLEDHHDYIPVLNSPAIKVGIEFVGDIPTMSESAE